MMTMEKNTKRQIVNEYISQYSPYESHPLGVNVGDVIRLAREKGCSINELTKEEVASL